MKGTTDKTSETVSARDARQLNSKKMGSAPIAKLLITMSLPAIISMLVQALYNVMDTVFVGMYYSGLGDAEYNSATQALATAFPMQLVIVAIGVGIGTGANALISKKLGEGDTEGANQAAKHAVLLAAAMSVVMSVIGLTTSGAFIAGLADVSGDSGNAVEYGTTYLTIVSSLSLAATIEITCGRILQSTGNMRVPMISQAMGAGINIALDPIFLFAFGWGVAGAAIATVISQFCSAIFTISMFFIKKQDVSISPKGIRPSGKTLGEIVNVGLPAFVTNAIGAVTYVALMLIMKAYAMGNTPQQVLGLYFKLNSLIFMPTFGLMQGALPILGYNYGAGNKSRYLSCLKLTTLISLGFMLIGLALFEGLPEVMLGMFSANQSTAQAGALALRLIAIAYPFAALGVTTISAFQSLQCGLRSLLMSMFRQLGIIVPFAAIFARFGVHMIWIAYPIAEAAAVFVFCPMLIGAIKKKFGGRQLA